MYMHFKYLDPSEYDHNTHAPETCALSEAFQDTAKNSHMLFPGHSCLSPSPLCYFLKEHPWRGDVFMENRGNHKLYNFLLSFLLFIILLVISLHLPHTFSSLFFSRANITCFPTEDVS